MCTVCLLVIDDWTLVLNDLELDNIVTITRVLVKKATLRSTSMQFATLRDGSGMCVVCGAGFINCIDSTTSNSPPLCKQLEANDTTYTAMIRLIL